MPQTEDAATVKGEAVKLADLSIENLRVKQLPRVRVIALEKRILPHVLILYDRDIMFHAVVSYSAVYQPGPPPSFPRGPSAVSLGTAFAFEG